MVNLYEPILLLLHKHKQQSGVFEKMDMGKNHTPTILNSKEAQRLRNAGEIQKQEILPKIGIQNTLFSEEKTRHWFEIQSQKNLETKDLKNHWNFIFPEMPWTKETIHWEDQNANRKLIANFGKSKDPFRLLVLFDSIKTGKIWIYLTYHSGKNSSCEIIFQTEKENSFRMIRRDESTLQKQLESLGRVKIRITKIIEKDEPYLSSMNGIFV